MASDYKFDFLIVGLGIAGATLAHRLIRKGKSVAVIDRGESGTSSRIAAGLINPVTGRNYVRAWMIEMLLEEAKRYYASFEREFNVVISKQMDIVRVFRDDREEERWMLRTGDPGYARFMGEVQHGGVIKEVFKDAGGYGVVKEGMRISFSVLLDAMRELLTKNGSYTEAHFDYSALEIHEDGYRYGGRQFSEIVFCEGAGMRDNPFFNVLPMADNKGEILVLRADDYPEDLMIRRKHFTIPLDNGLIWFGSANSWQDTSREPSEAAFRTLKDDLDKNYRLAYDIAGQKAAFRPVVKDRRPLLGTHPHYAGMHVFNGFGTKGASLAPYFSSVMSGYLIDHELLPEEVDIQRFDLGV